MSGIDGLNRYAMFERVSSLVILPLRVSRPRIGIPLSTVPTSIVLNTGGLVAVERAVTNTRTVRCSSLSTWWWGTRRVYGDLIFQVVAKRLFEAMLMRDLRLQLGVLRTKHLNLLEQC